MQVSKWGHRLAVRLRKAGDALVINIATTGEQIAEKHDRKTAFLTAMDAFDWDAPRDFRFDREEASAR